MGFIFKWLFRIVLVAVVAVVGFSFYLTTLGPDPIQKPERQMSGVWADYPFTSHYVAVKGARMHYIDEGPKVGPVFLFLHGNPTSSYLWRNVVPAVTASGGRAIAVDNIGFGASDRPDIGYTFEEHADYIEGFIDALELTDVTLVIHDWGSALGSDYAYRNQDNVKAIVFMEAIHRIGSMDELDPVAKNAFTAFRTKGVGEFLVMGLNGFIEKVLPLSIVRELSQEELDAYREPFPSFGSRYPVLVWPRQIPFDGSPEDVADRIRPFINWLPTSSVPKLLLYFEPGALIPRAAAEDIVQNWSNIEGKFLGDGIHFVQEDQGPAIGAAIVDWYGAQFPDPVIEEAAPTEVVEE
jgi:haloalkane dehalogenase